MHDAGPFVEPVTASRQLFIAGSRLPALHPEAGLHLEPVLAPVLPELEGALHASCSGAARLYLLFAHPFFWAGFFAGQHGGCYFSEPQPPGAVFSVASSGVEHRNRIDAQPPGVDFSVDFPAAGPGAGLPGYSPSSAGTFWAASSGADSPVAPPPPWAVFVVARAGVEHYSDCHQY